MWRFVFCVALGCSAIACTDNTDDTDTDVLPVGPELSHTPPTELIREGAPLTLTVDAQDEDGVAGVTLYYRTRGLSSWEVSYMEQGEDTVWTTTLDTSDVNAPGLEYYFKGIDDSSFQALTLLPENAPSEPYGIDVEVNAAALPFLADFEGATNGLLREVGWTAIAQGFEGYEFSLTQSESHSPTTSIWHRRGPEGLAAFKDWLISPPISLEAADQVQLTWWERGRYTEETNHSLWISTTSPDPRDTDAFEKVMDLPAPSETWERSELIDLSAWSGARVVYLAWYYEGQSADDWYIDDVDVRALQPDIELTEVTWTPVAPGGTSTVSITLSNASPLSAENLSVALDVAPEEGTSSAPQTIATLATDERATLTFSMDVPAEHLDNAYLPFVVDISDANHSWQHDARMVVGDTTSAEVDLYLFGTAFVTGWLGVGDVDDPDLIFVAFNEVLAGEETHSFTFDVTEYAALLPATPDARWWLKVEAEEWGFVERFDLVTGENAAEATVPAYFYENFPEWIFVPEPPDPVLIDSTTSAVPLSPGASSSWTLRLQNFGEATVGETLLSVTTTDASLSLTGDTSTVLATDGWSRNAIADFTTSIAVADDKKDSVPVAVDVLIQDEVESFLRTATLNVPWPVLEVSRVVIDDSASGDGDGVLDPDESAELEIYVLNSGDLSTFSMVSCTLSQPGGSATATLANASANYGVLTVGEAEDEDGFAVAVTSGALGDTLEFLMSCSDGTEAYDAPFSLVLGTPPWNSVSTTRDSGADALNGYEFDLLSGKYRSDGTTLELSLTSSTPYTSSTVFVEAWGNSPGGDYSYYQIVVQGGAAKVRGYDGKFTDLGGASVDFVSATELVISITLAPLGLLQDTISLGFASGFCGGTDYYCDHYPDGWGDPYNSGFYTSAWLDLTW